MPRRRWTTTVGGAGQSLLALDHRGVRPRTAYRRRKAASPAWRAGAEPRRRPSRASARRSWRRPAAARRGGWAASDRRLCGGRSRMHRRHMTVGLAAPARRRGVACCQGSAPAMTRPRVTQQLIWPPLQRTAERAAYANRRGHWRGRDSRSGCAADSTGTVGRLSSFGAQCSSESRQSSNCTRRHLVCRVALARTIIVMPNDSETNSVHIGPKAPELLKNAPAVSVLCCSGQCWRCVLSHHSKRACARQPMRKRAPMSACCAA